MRRLGQAQRRPNNRIGRRSVGSSLRSTQPRVHLVTQLLAAIIITGPAVAQERMPERRLVQAFRSYCIATAAAPGRVQAEIEKTARFESKEVVRYPNGGRLELGEVLDAVGQRDPHQRMLVAFGWGLGESGRKRICQVNVPWGEKAKLLAEVVGNLNMA